MRREDIPKLLGGYATNTLTPEERRALFEAALEDQAVFDALAKEEALRETIEDPQCRARIERAIEQPPQSWWSRALAAFRTPRTCALGASLAAAIVIGSVAIHMNHRPYKETATLEAPSPVPSAAQPAPLVGEKAEAPAAVEQKSSRLRAGLRSAPEASPRTPPPAPALTASKESPPPTEPLRDFAKAKEQEGPATVGGVAGGIAAAVPLPSRLELPRAAAPPPPPPAPAKVQALPDGNQNASMARQNQMANWRALPAEKPQEEAEAREAAKTFATSAGAASPAVRYTVMARDADGEYQKVDKLTYVQQAPPFRVALEPEQSGYLYALGGEDILMAVYAVPGRRYLVQTRPKDKEVTVILSPVPEKGRAAAAARILPEAADAKDESSVRTRSVIRIPLPQK